MKNQGTCSPVSGSEKLCHELDMEKLKIPAHALKNSFPHA